MAHRPPKNSESRPVSRVLSWTVIHLGRLSPAASSSLPGCSAGHAIAPLFGLASGGVYPATTVASRAVRSYRTFSPLPVSLPTIGGMFSAALSVGPCGPPRRYLAPCPVKPGLSSMPEGTATVRPALTGKYDTETGDSVFGFRFSVFGFRFPVSGFRFTVYGFRFTVYGLRIRDRRAVGCAERSATHQDDVAAAPARLRRTHRRD